MAKLIHHVDRAEQLAAIAQLLLLVLMVLISVLAAAAAAAASSHNHHNSKNHSLHDGTSSSNSSRSDGGHASKGKHDDTSPAPPPASADAIRKKSSSSSSSAANKPVPLSTVQSDAAFSLYYGRNFKVVQNLFYNFSYLLLQQSSIDPNLGHDWALNITVLPDPLSNNSTILQSGSLVAFLELLGALKKLKGIPSSLAYASPCLTQFIQEGSIPTLDLDDINTTTAMVDPNTVVFSSMAEYDTNPISNATINTTNYISFDASMDAGPLKRAEWIKFLAAFFDLEAKANDVYAQIESNYQCLNGSVRSVNETAMQPPQLVAWLSYDSQSALWTFSNDAYKLQLNLDAGGSNLDLFTLSRSFNMSNDGDVNDFHSILSTLQAVIDETVVDPSSLASYTANNFTILANVTDTGAFPFISNRSLWRWDKRMGVNNGVDWLEGAIAQPQLVLRDMIEILHPSTMGYNTTFFRNIAMGEAFFNASSLGCQHDIFSSLPPTIISCSSHPFIVPINQTS